ncbi:tyrosine-type recombinase/integrase [Dactylosporangium darangshiense]|uniref:tyrosine-type recombinase/integrase n=1 Tax=Dactylosporangium darangshiense TaxID=579108 RepID=UPI00362EE8DD
MLAGRISATCSPRRSGHRSTRGTAPGSCRRECVAAGLPAIRLHDLRHGCVSVLLALGVPPRTVIAIVGHSTLEMTMNVYGHVTLG